MAITATVLLVVPVLMSTICQLSCASVAETEGCTLSPIHEVQSCIEVDGEVFTPAQSYVAMGTTCVIHVCNVLNFAVCGESGNWSTRDGVLTLPSRCETVLLPNIRPRREWIHRLLLRLRRPPPPPPPPTPNCGHPGGLPNADISITSTMQGGTATYACRNGYKRTSGDYVRTCRSNRAWTGSEPYCAYMQSCTSGPCQNGARCTNGRDSYSCTCPQIWRGTHCEAIAHVCARDPCQHAESCVDGLDMYTCNCMAGWSGQICDIPADCGHPGEIDNGHVTVSVTTLGNPVTYSCNDDYNMTTGDATRECQADATWSGAPPVCIFANSCVSAPCRNGATCTNGLGDYTCTCTDQWSGVNCETDIQPPIVTNCSADIPVNATRSTETVSWTSPTFADPLGNDVDVTTNYNTPEHEFPWGDFTVQYAAVKPLNGLTAECVFTIHVRPTPCKELNVPVNGAKLCNGWKSDYGRFCMVACLDKFSISPASSFDQWYVCGASGHWMAAGPLPDCEVEFVDESEILTYHPGYASYTFTTCDSYDDVIDMKRHYIDKLNTTTGFGSFCTEYEDECHVDNVIFEC